MITSKECIKIIKEALRQFGEYSYHDKGPDEVIDMNTVLYAFKGMTAKQIADVLAEVRAYKFGDPFVSSVLVDLQDEPGMDDLYADKRLEELF
jgi:hypothetical protein